MTRNYSTVQAISQALKYHGPCVETDTVVDLSYDSKEHCWYARYMQVSHEGKYQQVGNIGFGATPLNAVIQLRENNRENSRTSQKRPSRRNSPK